MFFGYIFLFSGFLTLSDWSLFPWEYPVCFTSNVVCSSRSIDINVPALILHARRIRSPFLISCSHPHRTSHPLPNALILIHTFSPHPLTRALPLFRSRRSRRRTRTSSARGTPTRRRAWRTWPATTSSPPSSRTYLYLRSNKMKIFLFAT
jgi:hypothetical protein